ncbi:unnamed protein product, partial [marine sediment metagenome]
NKVREVPGLKIIDISVEFIDIVRNPQHGYGKNLNPCIDCRILMLKKAKKYGAEVNADFLVTGEVLGQRPMSQRLEILMLVDREAGCDGNVVRPLSGGLLLPTLPEKKGLIKRCDLLKIKGRSRKIELELAQKKKITEFFSPSGGCLLTDPAFSRRLADLMRFQEKISIKDIELLKVGRHFRFTPKTKLIVGRNEQENKTIEHSINSATTFLYVPDTGSPNALLLGNKEYLETAASITALYSDKKDEAHVEVRCSTGTEVRTLSVPPIKRERL